MKIVMNICMLVFVCVRFLIQVVYNLINNCKKTLLYEYIFIVNIKNYTQYIFIKS